MNNSSEIAPRSIRKKCFVPECLSTTANTPNKTFIYVPRDERRKTWCTAAGYPRMELPPTSYICEDHFNLREDMENYYEWKLMPGVRKIMRKDAYPRFFECQLRTSSTFPRMGNSSVLKSINKSSSIPNLNSPSSSRISTSQCRVSSTSCLNLEQAGNPCPPPFPEANDLAQDHLVHNMSYRLFSVDRYVQTETFYNDKKTQTECLRQSIGVECEPDVKNVSISPTKSLSPSHCQQTMEIDPESSDSIEKCSSMECSVSTAASASNQNDSFGISSSDESVKIKSLMETIFESVTRIVIEDNPLLFLGLPKQSMYVIEELEKRSKVQIKYIYLILKKIRQNVPNSVLAYEFGYTEAHISRIFNENISIIAGHFQQLIHWPSQKDIIANLPIQFRIRYTNVQSIIDCLEIGIERLSNAIHQAASWSEYKKCNTAKYLISITPDGLINFISPGYGGRTSDMEILRDSGYLNVLPSGTTVLADRGFKQIETLLRQHNCSLVRPVSVMTNVKLKKNEVNLSRRVSSVRIHVERVIRRIREFRMLQCHSIVNHNLLDRPDDAVVIAAALVNLQSKIIK